MALALLLDSSVYWRSLPGMESWIKAATEAVAKLRSQSCIIDGEAVVCGDDGIAPSIVFDTAVMTRACSYGRLT